MLSARPCSKSFADINYLIHMASLGSGCYYYSIWQMTKRGGGIWRFKSNWVLSGWDKTKGIQSWSPFLALLLSQALGLIYLIELEWLPSSTECSSNSPFLDYQWRLAIILLMILGLRHLKSFHKEDGNMAFSSFFQSAMVSIRIIKISMRINKKTKLLPTPPVSFR